MCYCEATRRWAENSFAPIKFDANRGVYTFQLSDLVSIPISFCFHCGGEVSKESPLMKKQNADSQNEDSEPEKSAEKQSEMVRDAMFLENDKPCECSLFEKLAADSNTWVEFDITFNHFYIVFEQWIQTLYYCPSCGGKLPESNSWQLFFTCSEAEKNELTQKCGTARTIGEVISALGEPDEVYSNDYYEKGLSEVKKVIEYTNLSPKHKLVVQELKDDTVSFAVQGKFRDDLFTKPSDSEVEELKRSLASAKNADEVVAVLGQPEKKYRFTESKCVRHRLMYTKLSETFDLMVLEQANGGIELLVQDKLRKDLLSQHDE
jgi:hypothetical protein